MRDGIPRAVYVITLCALAFLPGCVYYNTFYHAKAAAREAAVIREVRPPETEPTVRELELLERAIEKSGRVLRMHPDSAWADDALLLMGQSLYHKGQYEAAENRLNEFMSLYPDSELRVEAEYSLAVVMLQTGNPVSAEEILSEIAYAEPPLDLSDDALIMMGEARRKRGRNQAAAEAYRELLDRFSGSDRRAEARFLAAENYSEMGELEQAASQYAAVAEEAGGRELLFEARLRLAEARLGLSEPDEALEVLRDLEGRTAGDDELDKVLLLVGRAQTTAGELEEAISTYEGVAASRERTPAAAEAHYRIGLIHRDERGDLDAALESFETARSEAPRSETAELADAAREDIEALRRYLEIIERRGAEAADDSLAGAAAEGAVSADTTAVTADNGGAAADSLAAHPPDAAADSLAAPGESADAAPDSLVDAASDTSGLEPVSEVAEARFRAAELYLFKLDDPEAALRYYGEVIEKHGMSRLAPKAALARAWILRNKLESLAEARAAYAYVIDRFPGTEYADSAQNELRVLSEGSVETEDRSSSQTPEDQ